MKYNELEISSHKSAKRVGRGISAGQGKTAGRGTKGQKSRAGSTRRPGFAGGQNPLMQQLPKLPGFKSFHAKMEIILTRQLDQFAGKTVDSALLADAGLISSAYVPVKLLAGGQLTKPVAVKLQAASSGAIAEVKKAGGSFESVLRPGQPKTRAEKTKRVKTAQ